jgi:hypothetical protein
MSRSEKDASGPKGFIHEWFSLILQLKGYCPDIERNERLKVLISLTVELQLRLKEREPP